MRKFILVILFLLSSCNLSKVEECISLNEAVIVIDPGHGGKDNGASNGILIEDALNLEISFLISNYLINKGAMVYFTRTGDYDLSDPSVSNKKKDDLKERLKIINTFNPDAFISIHMNIYPSSNVNGAQAFYYKNDELALCIQKELNILNEKEKKAKKEDIYLLRNSLVPSCLVECGFVSGDKDYKYFQTKEYKELIAKNIAVGVEKYLTKN